VAVVGPGRSLTHAAQASTFVDRFERKRLLLTMYFGFALATLACGWRRPTAC
jgi:predicted MFS family arabinose efflux permease